MKRKALATILTAVAINASAGDVYDYIVAQDGSGDFASVQEAIDAIGEKNDEQKNIYIKAGTYREHVCIPEGKNRISLIGEGADVTLISDDRVSGGEKAVPVDKGATMVVMANDVTLQGIAIMNSYGFMKQEGPQALALYAKGDRIAIEYCALMSYQDTYRTSNSSNGRNYVAHSLIVGAVDFIYGNGNAWIESCMIFVNRKSGGWIVAPRHGKETRWGYVFKRCSITAEGDPQETQVWLGRPWKNEPKAVFIDTKTELTIPAEGWWPTMGGLPKVFAEYGTMDANGDKIDLSKRRKRYYVVDKEKKDTTWCEAKSLLTTEEANAYTLGAVMGGEDGWRPEKLFAHDENAKIIGYAIVRKGKIVSFSKKKARNSLPVNEFGCIARNYYSE